MDILRLVWISCLMTKTKQIILFFGHKRDRVCRCWNETTERHRAAVPHLYINMEISWLYNSAGDMCKMKVRSSELFHLIRIIVRSESFVANMSSYHHDIIKASMHKLLCLKQQLDESESDVWVWTGERFLLLSLHSSVLCDSVTLFSVTLFSVTLWLCDSVTLFSVTLLSGFHLLGEELTQSHSFNCHKQLQVKSEAELRSVQNTLNLLNQSLSPTFSRKLWNMKSSEHLVEQLFRVRKQRIMGNIHDTVNTWFTLFVTVT